MRNLHAKAVSVPARDEGLALTDKAIDETLTVTERYPYFLQQWGFQAWNVAQQSPISKEDIQAATPAAIGALDASFFRMRFDRLTPKERQYLGAMAALGDEPQRSSAARLMRSTSAAGPARDSLIRKGMIYSPEHSIIAFAVSLFGDFMGRTMAEGEE